jgi:3-oxoacyl-[acyl-carrier protein] reductase
MFRQIVDVNLTGSFIVCRACLDHMGDTLAIVNLASVSGRRANAGHAAYGASQAGVIMMSQVLANEWGASGVAARSTRPLPLPRSPAPCPPIEKG